MNTNTQTKGNLSLAQVKRLIAACAIPQASAYGKASKVNSNANK